MARIYTFAVLQLERVHALENPPRLYSGADTKNGNILAIFRTERYQPSTMTEASSSKGFVLIARENRYG
jgi:hypothetical protein